MLVAVQVRGERGERKTVLLIEDADDDVFLFRRTLKKLGWDWSVHAVQDTCQATAYLDGMAEEDLPSAVICDYTQSKPSALEFVQWLRSRARLKETPTVIWTGAEAAIDEAPFSELDVKGIMRKSSGPEALGDYLRSALPA